MELNQVCELFQRTIQIIYTLYAAVILNTYVNGAAIGVQESNTVCSFSVYLILLKTPLPGIGIHHKCFYITQKQICFLTAWILLSAFIGIIAIGFR